MDAEPGREGELAVELDALDLGDAAPRPIIAIVPLSRYENGLAVLPSRSARIVFAAALAALERDGPELRMGLAVLVAGCSRCRR